MYSYFQAAHIVFISICNSMVSNAIWKKHARMSAIWGIWKTPEYVFFQNAREHLILPINNIRERKSSSAEKGNSVQITVLLFFGTACILCIFSCMLLNIQ